MNSILIAFISSLALTILIIRYRHLHAYLSADSDLSGPQKFHKRIVPRIGGVSIAFGLFLAMSFEFKSDSDAYIQIALLLSCIPTFAVGITEDITKKISVNTRLLLTAISSALMVYLLDIHITRLDIPILDPMLNIPLVGTILTIFSVTGLANAYNIIDGFHGLSSMVGIITLLALAYIGFIFGDRTIVYLSMTMASSILGFFLFNYPRGLIFLGDGGAYLIGFWIAALSVLVTYRHQEISPWFAFLINIYPIAETLFTIYRRKIHQGKSPGQPDGIHIHTLIYRRILISKYDERVWLSANARTAPYFWILTIISVTPAILYWHSTFILMSASAIFIIFYIWLYTRIVRFKTPRWMHI